MRTRPLEQRVGVDRQRVLRCQRAPEHGQDGDAEQDGERDPDRGHPEQSPALALPGLAVPGLALRGLAPQGPALPELRPAHVPIPSSVRYSQLRVTFTIRLTTITKELTTSSRPWTTGMSRVCALSRSSCPRPGRENTASAATAPASMSGKSLPRMVRAGPAALRSACRIRIRRYGSPRTLAPTM